ncbi:SDR family oxidoreductase [Actinomadura sp. HBU206391]|uniref:SDR family oxidoreductase n=1 Tax=Actinomadura sp. HBU206391 TaxID=2731692 RepID=UPI00164FB631|nr:SDR family oxidoreductase [Actinomadura sp. HBU206391]MBC6458825.1 SDR family oxidoreductase [Actinomadura sp. HBU206391]
MVNAHAGEIALVTGANKGIGREIVRRLAAEGMVVYLGARDENRGRDAARELSRDGGDVRYLRLDVTDQAQIEVAVERVADEFGRLDALVNNAGIAVEWGDAVPDVTAAQVRRTYEVNVFGVVAMTHAFVPLLRRSPAARVVNMSSPLGSLRLLSDFSSMIADHALLAYSSSKSALNALTLVYAKALADDGILVNAVNPGYVATDLNDHRGALTVEQGADVPVRLALLGSDGPTGSFAGAEYVHDGHVAEAIVPW